MGLILHFLSTLPDKRLVLLASELFTIYLHHQCLSHFIITSFREIWRFDTTLFLPGLHVPFIQWMLAT